MSNSNGVHKDASDKPLTLAVRPKPPRAGPEIFILRLKGSERFTFTIYSESLFGIEVHWAGDRSEPHYDETDRCPGCRRNLPRRWKGFLHCHCHEKRQDVFLEMTPGGAESLEKQVAAGEVYRGLCIAVQRTKGDNGRLLIRLLQSKVDADKLPPALDPLPSLRKIWGLDPERDQGGREFPLRGGGFFST